MIKLPVLTNHGKKTITVPSNWDEITWEKYILMETSWNRQDPIRLFAIMTGVPFDDLAASEDPHIEETLYGLTGFIYNSPDWTALEMPSRIVLGGKVVKIPKDLGAESLGQKVMLNQAIVQIKSMPELMTQALAIYLQPKLDGKFDDKRINAVKEMLMKARALDCYAIASFFLKSPPVLMRFGMLGCPVPGTKRTTPLAN